MFCFLNKVLGKEKQALSSVICQCMDWGVRMGFHLLWKDVWSSYCL